MRSSRASLQGWRGWPIVTGIFALCFSAWFVWSIVIREKFLRSASFTPNIVRLPVPVWWYVFAVLFAVLGFTALRRHPRVQPILFGAGVLSVILSGLAVRTNPWDWAGVALGFFLALSAWFWSPAAPS